MTPLANGHGQPARRHVQPAAPWRQAVLVGLAAWALLILAYAGYWPHLYPRGDEFPLIVASQQFSLGWFTEGFDRYFLGYPEWTQPYTAYLRPTVNAVYRLFAPWSELAFRLQLILASHGIHALNTALVFLVAAGPLRARPLAVWMAAGAMFASLAFFGSAMPLQPAFAMDGLAACLCLLSILAAGSRRDLLSVALFAWALLGKESSLPVAVALLGFGAWRRRWTLVAGVLFVLGAWMALRWNAFGGFGPVHSLSRPFQSLFTLGEGLSGLSTLRGPGAAMRDATGPLMTLALLGCLGLGLPSAWRALREATAGPTSPRDHLTLLTLAVLACVVYLLATDTHLRFTYVFGVMLVLLLASDPRRIARAGSAGLLLAGAALAVASWARIDLAAQAAHQQAARSLVATLAALPAEGPPVYLVNDHIGGYASAASMQAFAGLRRPFVRLNSVQIRCTASDMPGIRATVTRSGSQQVVDARTPACAPFVFEGAQLSGAMFDAGGHIVRNAQLRYEFPDVDRSSAATAVHPDRLKLGARMRVLIEGPATVVAYDHVQQRWQVW